MIVADYNNEKDRLTIEATFEALIRFVEELNDEDRRAIREGLNEEALAIYELLRKPDLTKNDIAPIKDVAVQLLATLKAEKLRIAQWREKEATRDAVRQAIHDSLYSNATGRPPGRLLHRGRSEGPSRRGLPPRLPRVSAAALALLR